MSALDIPPIRVLLVDDEEPAFLLLRRLLSKVSNQRFHLDWVPSFATGLKIMAEKRHEVYLVDYRLGVDNGLELLREAMALGVQSPVIILTGSDDPKVDIAAAEIGATDFLLKDELNPMVLDRAIRYALQHHNTLRALQKSNERFRLLFERSMDAILISDREGKLVEANSAACELFGISRERLMHMKWSELPTPSLRARPNQNAPRLGELSFTRPNGKRCFVEYSASQLAPDLHLSILRDVTQSRDLEREIQQTSEREQRRLGQDLHDGVGQALTGIGFMAKSLERKLQSRSIPEAVEAGTIANLISEALKQTRQLARGLCPVVLEHNDICAALEQLGQNIETFFSVNCQIACEPGTKIADNAVAIHLYRIAQEAATNAIKHGKASNVKVQLCLTTSRLILRICDDGVGFPKDAPAMAGMGLRVMQHRARIIGGVLSVRQAKTGGTIITCSVRKNLVYKRPSGDTAFLDKMDVRSRRNTPTLTPA